MLLYLLTAWLLVEVVYSTAQRLALGAPRTGRLAWLIRFLYEPLRDSIVDRPPLVLLLRDTRHATTGSIYEAGAKIQIEVQRTPAAGGRIAFTPVLLRICADRVLDRPSLEIVLRLPPVVLEETACTFNVRLPPDADTGMYLLELLNEFHSRVAISLFINGPLSSEAVVGAVVPTFTIWGYDEQSGWYPGHGRPRADALVHKLAKTGFVGWASAFVVRVVGSRLGIHLNQPFWPVHWSVNLNAFYRTNHRWSKWLWDADLAGIEGIWNDDIDILIPFFALADGCSLKFRIYSDLDMHRREPRMLLMERLIFVGQESLTEPYWKHLTEFSASGRALVLWCPQGFGYRQVDYDVSTGLLRYVCSRGRRGFWNERLEDADPPWDESALLGFSFPTPDSAAATNPHKIVLGSLEVTRTFSTASYSLACGQIIPARIWDGQRWQPALNWMGGEPFRRVNPEAEVLIGVRGDTEIIGLGRFHNVVVVSPTFLGALWAYGNIEPDVVKCAFEYALGLLN